MLTFLRLVLIEFSWTSNPTDIADTSTSYYQNLFTSVVSQSTDAAVSTIQRMTTADMNAKLSSDFMEWEVKEPIKQMATNLKAFEPDEMPSIFLPALWACSW